MRLKLLAMTVLSTALALSAAEAKPIKTENLICLSNPLDINIMAYLDNDNKILYLNGEMHAIQTYYRMKNGAILKTYAYENVEGRAMYIAFSAINSGKAAGIYMGLHDANSGKPDSIVQVSCHRYDWKRARYDVTRVS